MDSSTRMVSDSDAGSATTSGTGSLAVGSGASARTNDTAIGVNSTITADGSTAVGSNTTINSTNSVALGADSQVESGASGGIALGQDAVVRTGATDSVALGRGAVATEANTISVGSAGKERRIVNVGEAVDNTDAVNLGQMNSALSKVGGKIDWIADSNNGHAQAHGTCSVAIGSNATARSYDTAIGAGSTVEADGSTAVGSNTYIASTNAVALGADSRVESGAAGGVALGQDARIETGATGSVALGRGSVATEANTVSVGSVGNERRIVNLAPGVNPTDAVNVSQLNTVDQKTRVNAKNIAINAQNIAANRVTLNQHGQTLGQHEKTLAQHDTRIKQNRSSIQENRASIDNLDRSLNEVQKESRAGIAAVAALVELQPTVPGKTMVNLGTASFKDQSAFGLTMVHRVKKYDFLYFNAGASYAGDEVLVRAGCSFEF
jgi:hypothetical protein